MSPYEHHTLTYWYTQLEKLVAGEGNAQSAGSVASAVGQSRTTAKKYLKKLVKMGSVNEIKALHFNGQEATLYAPSAWGN